jgi:putative ABC transport system permease protein
MFAMLPLAWRSLTARRVRTILTIIGIALGVGMLYASLATSIGIDQAVDRTVDAIVGRADLRVSAFQERGLSDKSVDAIRTTSGVAVAVPAIERRLYLRRTDGTNPAPGPVTILGIDPVLDPQVHDLQLVSGALLARPDETAALVTERLAREDGYGLGSELTLQAVAGPVQVRVVGILAGDGPLSGASGRTVVVPIDLARTVFSLPGVSRVDIRVTDGTSPQLVASAITTRLSSEPYVLSAPPEMEASLRATTAEFQATLAMIAAVSLFVGAFLVFNTLSLTVVERAREVGLLRAAGATHGQIVSFVMVGAIALGLVGSLAGLGVGLGLSILVGIGIQATGAAPFEQPIVPPETASIAFGIGVFVALAAALEPAWRATRISPIEALKLRIDPGAARRAQLRWLVVVFLSVGLVGLLAWPRAAGDAAALRSLAIYGILVVATLLSPLFIAPLARIVGLPFALVARLDERLARGSLGRDRSRTALTLGGLAVGLAMIVAIGGVAQQARASASAWLASVVPGDEIATSIRPVVSDEPAQATLAGVRGVQMVTPVATFDLAYRGVRLDAAAMVGTDLLADGRLRFEAGDRAGALIGLDSGGSVILARSVADRLGLGLGSTMAFAATGGQSVSLEVTGIVERTLPGRTGETVVVGWNDALAKFGVTGADFFGVRFAPGQAGTSRPAFEEAARSMALEPATLDQVQGAVSDALGRVFGLFDALALIAVLIAALGIVNTLTMSVVERVRELGILRATGMTGRQVARMVVVEAGILGLVGAVLGILTGLAAGAAMLALGTGFRVIYEPPWLVMGLAVLLGLLVSMAAAYYPARLASRLSIVRAVQFE